MHRRRFGWRRWWWRCNEGERGRIQRRSISQEEGTAVDDRSAAEMRGVEPVDLVVGEGECEGCAIQDCPAAVIVDDRVVGDGDAGAGVLPGLFTIGDDERVLSVGALLDLVARDRGVAAVRN